MIFRKLADVKREQELADKSKNEPNTDLIETASTNSAFKKLMSKFRKRSIDSRADVDNISHSIENAILSGQGTTTSNNLLSANQPSPGGRNRHSNSIVSLLSSSTTINNNTNASQVNLTKSLAQGLESTGSASKSNSTLALPSSTSNARLLTINERQGDESKSDSGSSPSQHRKNTLPVLPPLSQAQSVKQKWNILLSKAKGGVENIPKAFLISEIHEMNEHDSNEQQRLLQQTSEQPSPPNGNQPSFKLTLPESTSTESSLLPFSKQSQEAQAKLFAAGLSNATTTTTINNLLTPTTPGHILDESGGFGFNLDEPGSARPHLTATKSSSSRYTDDGLMLNKNPQHLLFSLIEYRQELKTDIENLNVKIASIDKKIMDVLKNMSGGDSGSNGGGNGGNGPSGGGGNGGTGGSGSTSGGQSTTRPFLSVNGNMTRGFDNSVTGSHNNESNLLDSNATFSMNSNFHLSQMAQLSHPTYKPNKHMVLETEESNLNSKNNLRNSTLSINTATTPTTGNSPLLTKKTDKMPVKIGPPTTISVNPNNVTIKTKNEVTSSINKPSSKQGLASRFKKSDLAGSSASVIYSAVSGVSSLLNNSILNQQQSVDQTVTSGNAKPTHPSTSHLATHSNYNVNIIPTDSDHQPRHQLTTSASENLIKDVSETGGGSSSRKPRDRSSSKGSSSRHHHHHHHHHHKHHRDKSATIIDITAQAPVGPTSVASQEEAGGENEKLIVWTKKEKRK